MTLVNYSNIDNGVKMALRRAEKGNLQKEGYLQRNLVNCKMCPHNGNPTCPHGIAKGAMHSNGYCLFWFEQCKELSEVADTRTKILQVAEAVKNNVMLDSMFAKWNETGKIPENYVKLQRNQITHLNAMRRQDEGVKINANIETGWKEFINVVEAQAKVIDEKKQDIVVEAEIVEEEEKNGNKPDKREGEGVSGEEVQGV